MNISTFPDNTVPFNIVAEALNSSPESEIIAFEGVRPTDIDEVAPLRLEGLAIMLCTNGSGKIGIDLSDHELEPGTLLIIQPNNYLRYIHTTEDFQAYTVLCSIGVVEAILPRLTDMLPMLIQHRLMPATKLTPDEAEGIKAFYRFIKLKLTAPPTRFLHHKIRCMLQAALFEMMDIRLARVDAAGITHSRKDEIMARFILSVCENFKVQRQVSFYANQLCITAKHLSTVVKELSGRTAGEWIDNYVIMEAKMLLRTTDLTIQEITTRLNFTNQSFFGKYFKHHCGMSPSMFRQEHH